MIKFYNQINLFLGKKEKKRAFLLLILSIITSLFEVVGIASILPFMAVLSSPEVVYENEYLKQFYDYFNFQSVDQFLIFLGVLALFLIVIGNCVKALTHWQNTKFSMMAGHKISIRLLKQYLYQKYDFYLQNNTSDIAKNILSEISTLINNFIMPLINSITHLITLLFIVGLLIVVNPVLTIIISVTVGAVFVVIYAVLRYWFQRLGQKRNIAQEERYKVLNEGFLGIKNIKLMGKEGFYINMYEKSSNDFHSTLSALNIISELPRYLLEVVAFGGILVILLFYMTQNENIDQILPVLSLYAFSLYRLLPAAQMLFRSWSKISFNNQLLDNICKELIETTNVTIDENQDSSLLGFNKNITFEEVGFSYFLKKGKFFKDINFEIKANSIVGIVGRTGSGKTTFVDLLLGLLIPDTGQIKVDGTPISDDNRRAWQNNCSYVSQNISLIDDTIISNIAFGEPADSIDLDKIKFATKIAAIDSFIENELDDGYNTSVGENGIRLSGGQKQRIGIARAIYSDRPVIVLDEATSALDIQTEQNVLNAIKGLGSNKTIIMITHRPQTLDMVDDVLDLNDFKA